MLAVCVCVQDIVGVVPVVKHAFPSHLNDIVEMLNLSQMHYGERNLGVRCVGPWPLPSLAHHKLDVPPPPLDSSCIVDLL